MAWAEVGWEGGREEAAGSGGWPCADWKLAVSIRWGLKLVLGMGKKSTGPFFPASEEVRTPQEQEQWRGRTTQGNSASTGRAEVQRQDQRLGNRETVGKLVPLAEEEQVGGILLRDA